MQGAFGRVFLISKGYSLTCFNHQEHVDSTEALLRYGPQNTRVPIIETSHNGGTPNFGKP